MFGYHNRWQMPQKELLSVAEAAADAKVKL